MEVNVSKPIVPFRETIIPRPKVDRVNEAIQDQNTLFTNAQLREFENDQDVLDEGLVEMLTPDCTCVVRIRAVPLPAGVVECLVKHQEVIKTLDALVAEWDGQNPDGQAIFKVDWSAFLHTPHPYPLKSVVNTYHCFLVGCWCLIWLSSVI